MVTAERTKEILKKLHETVVQFEEEEAVKWAKIALEEGVDPFVATMDGLAEGMMEAAEDLHGEAIHVPKK